MGLDLAKPARLALQSRHDVKMKGRDSFVTI
jgi:hypothetical protein